MRLLLLLGIVGIGFVLAISGLVLLFVYLIRQKPRGGSEEVEYAESEEPGGFHDWVRNPERRHAVAEMLAQQKQERRNLRVPENISDAEIAAMIERLFVLEDEDHNQERLKLVGQRAAPFLVKALDDPRVAVRLEAQVSYVGFPVTRLCDLLRPFDSDLVVRTLAKYVDNEDEKLRSIIAEELCDIGKPECVEPVCKLLSGSNDSVHLGAMIGINRGIENQSCDRRFLDGIFPALVRLLNQGDYFGSAPIHLLTIDRDRAIRIMLSDEYFTPDNPKVDRIIAAFNQKRLKIPHDKLLPLIARLKPHIADARQKYGFLEALKAYGINPDDNANALLRTELQSSDWQVREAAAEALACLQGIADPERVVLDAIEEFGFAGVKNPIQNYYLAHIYGAEVANGGHAQFFVNWSGAVARGTLNALTEIGAKEQAAVLQDALELFGLNGPPEDQDEFETELARIHVQFEERFDELDSRFYGCTEDLDILLPLYATRKMAAFQNPAE